MNDKPRFTIEVYGWLLHGAGAVAVAATVAAAIFLVFDAIAAESATLSQQSDEFASFLSNSTDIRTTNQALSAELSDKENTLNRLYEQIPDSPRESDFLAQLSQLAREGHLALRNYRPGTPLTKDRHSEMEIALSAQGGYEGICLFLNGLGELPRVCRVSTLQITVPRDDSDEYTVELTLRIYFASSKSVAAKSVAAAKGGPDA